VFSGLVMPGFVQRSLACFFSMACALKTKNRVLEFEPVRVRHSARRLTKSDCHANVGFGVLSQRMQDIPVGLIKLTHSSKA
jgi:hypothetical protein